MGGPYFRPLLLYLLELPAQPHSGTSAEAKIINIESGAV
jgi:hypothetical protein